MPGKEQQPTNESTQKFMLAAKSFIEDWENHDLQITRKNSVEAAQRMDGIVYFIQSYNDSHTLLRVLGNSYIKQFLSEFNIDQSKVHGIPLLTGRASDRSELTTLVLTSDGFLLLDEKLLSVEKLDRINLLDDNHRKLFGERMIFGDITADKLEEMLQSRFETIADQISKTPTPSTPHAVGIG